MNPIEAVALTRYVRALCPQQKFDEFTADAWTDVLAPYDLEDCRRACVALARKKPFISPAEIIEEIRQRRGENARDIQGPGLPAAVPDADPDDVPAYLAAVRQQRTRAADGLELKPRNVLELIEGVGRDIPKELPVPRGPMGVVCPNCEAKPRHGCKTPSGRRLTAFHPSRIDLAKEA